MKMPEPPPEVNLTEIMKEDPEFLLTGLTDPQILSFLDKVNNRYLYWDKFKYQKMPQRMNPEEVWIFLKWNRKQQYKSIPRFQSSNGKSFKYWLPDNMQRILQKIDKNAAGQLLSTDSSMRPGEMDEYVVNSLVDEAISSSILEGAATTRDIARRVIKKPPKQKSHAEKMILNNYRAMKEIKELLSERLSPDLIMELHEIITDDTFNDPKDAGFLRRDNDVKVIDPDRWEILHDLPDFRELPERLDRLCEFANEGDSDDGRFIHPVVRAVLIHFQLGYDHYFVDGNGRTARAIFYWYLLKHGYWLFEYISISSILLNAPAKYARSFLYTEIDDNDATYFIHYQLNVIERAMGSLMEYIENSRHRVVESTNLLKKYKGLNFRQKTLLLDAIKNPLAMINFSEYSDCFDVVHQTARADILELVKRGILEKHREGKNMYFFRRINY